MKSQGAKLLITRAQKYAYGCGHRLRSPEQLHHPTATNSQKIKLMATKTATNIAPYLKINIEINNLSIKKTTLFRIVFLLLLIF